MHSRLLVDISSIRPINLSITLVTEETYILYFRVLKKILVEGIKFSNRPLL
jgi:hypothetical protein